ncbi:hypothetical protein, partial [Roseovarius dicentrarchi]|uniref:hypothetical protein n=1 Tax=Roseovarius dicentrarchi TaxID=2250573 RepID=UPI001939ACFF
TFHQYHLLIPPRYSARMLTSQVGQFYSLITHPSGSILHADSQGCAPLAEKARGAVADQVRAADVALKRAR